MHESPNSVHAAIDMAHAYMHCALDQMLHQSPPQIGTKHESNNMQNESSHTTEHTYNVMTLDNNGSV